MMLEIFFMACAFVVLYKSSNYLVDFSTKIASYFNLPEFVIGFVIIAVGTSLPELSVSLMSSMMGVQDISVGNVIGANIANISLVLGIAALVYSRMKIESETLMRDMLSSIFLSIFPLSLLLFFPLHPFMGFLFIGMFAVYMLRMMGQKQLRRRIEVDNREAVIAGALIVPAIALVIFSSYIITHFGQEIASIFSISSFLVGMTIVAMGTTLPELSTIMVSLKKGHSHLAWGNIMGSLVTNSTLVMGTTAVFLSKPLVIVGQGLLPAIALLLSLQIILLAITRMDRELRRSDGISFLLIYAFYVALEFLINA